MFYSLTGKIVIKEANGAAIDCGGVAFYCSCSFNTLVNLGETGETVTLFTYLSVREDALDLFGFHTKAELECFKLLIGVTGVGPKAALAILSQLSPEKLSLAVASGDTRSITMANGIGPKIAQRVVMELKDKLKLSDTGESVSGASGPGAASATQSSSEALSALIMLGYSKADASNVIAKLDSSLDTQTLIKEALKRLS